VVSVCKKTIKQSNCQYQASKITLWVMYLILTLAFLLAVYLGWTKLSFFLVEMCNLKQYVFAILVTINSKHGIKFSVEQYLKETQNIIFGPPYFRKNLEEIQSNKSLLQQPQPQQIPVIKANSEQRRNSVLQITSTKGREVWFLILKLL